MLSASYQYSELAGTRRQFQHCAAAALKQPQASSLLQVQACESTSGTGAGVNSLWSNGSWHGSTAIRDADNRPLQPHKRLPRTLCLLLAPACRC